MATNPITSFDVISPLTLLYTPPTHAKGQLIILCTWMGAADKHISKYVAFHQKHFPNAKILLLKSTVLEMMRTYAAQQVAMQPAVSVIQAVLEECGYSIKEAREHRQCETLPHVLIHLLSTGGANTVTQLLTCFRQEAQVPLPLVGVVCDSAPAGASYWKGITALRETFPEGFPMNILAPIAAHVILGIEQIQIMIGRYEHPEELYRSTLKDEKFFEDPEDGKHRIAYVASKADKLTVWEDVVAHAKETRAQGWQVQELLYEETPHCNHMSKDENAYLTIVKNIWERTDI